MELVYQRNSQFCFADSSQASNRNPSPSRILELNEESPQLFFPAYEAIIDVPVKADTWPVFNYKEGANCSRRHESEAEFLGDLCDITSRRFYLCLRILPIRQAPAEVLDLLQQTSAYLDIAS